MSAVSAVCSLDVSMTHLWTRWKVSLAGPASFPRVCTARRPADRSAQRAACCSSPTPLVDLLLDIECVSERRSVVL